MLDSFGVDRLADVPTAYMDFLDALPYFMETEGYLLVHAGLNFKKADPLEDTKSMIWIRDWHGSINREWLGDRIIVHGHTPARQQDIRARLGRLNEIPALCIDNGCVYGMEGMDHLCAFDLTNRRLYFQQNIDYEDFAPVLPSQTSPERFLYFDIDGVLLDYDDQPKAALLDGKLEAALKEAKFDRLFCVSGWSDIVNVPILRQRSYEEQKEMIWQKLSALFPDREWFLEKLTLVYDTDRRCRYISMQADWYYVDDWAEKFFVEAHGEALFEKWEGLRILETDAFGDGQDLLDWLQNQKQKHGKA